MMPDKEKEEVLKEENIEEAEPKEVKKRGRGRPPGSKNKPKNIDGDVCKSE